MTRRRIVLALAIVELLVAISVVGFRSLSTSNEVTPDEALSRFRSAGPPAEATSPPGLPKGELRTPAPSVAATASPAPGEAAATAQPATPAPMPAAGEQMMTVPPEPGVYEWRTQGWEEAANVRRDLPERSQRIVELTGPKTWVNTHLYSDKHTERFDLSITEQGVFSSFYETDVTFGFTFSERMDFEPPLRFSSFPLELDQRWQGEWSGDTRGTYSGRTFEHTTLEIGGTDVEVWGIEVVMNMSGDVSGRVVTRIWVAPAYRMTVKEFYNQEVRSGPGTYRGEWTITLLDLTPKR